MKTRSIAPRRPALAAVLSALLPGLGQLYNGQLNKGFFLFLGFAFVSVPFLAFVALALPASWLLPSLVLSLFVTLGLYIAGIVDAWKVARRSTEYRPLVWQQPAIYVALVLFAYLSVLSGATRYVRTHIIEAFRIPSDSMSPNVVRGDYLFADKRVNCGGCKGRIRRGDIAIFVYPNDRTKRYIKRIIGLPGDEVRIERGDVSVNAQRIARSPEVNGYRIERGDDREYRVRWTEHSETEDINLSVPPGQVFVLGDNRSESKDSRHFGTVPLRDVIGRASQIWFSISSESGVRWDRLGKTL